MSKLHSLSKYKPLQNLYLTFSIWVLYLILSLINRRLCNVFDCGITPLVLLVLYFHKCLQVHQDFTLVSKPIGIPQISNILWNNMINYIMSLQFQAFVNEGVRRQSLRNRANEDLHNLDDVFVEWEGTTM